MSESSTTPSGSERRFDAELFARQTVNSIGTSDAYASVLERRVVRLEEIAAARWPRSMVLRWASGARDPRVRCHVGRGVHPAQRLLRRAPRGGRPGGGGPARPAGARAGRAPGRGRRRTGCPDCAGAAACRGRRGPGRGVPAVTAVTGPATAADTGWPLSDSGRQVARSGPPEGRSATFGRQVPTGGAATPATVAGSCRPVVPAARRASLGAVISDGSATDPRPALVPLSAQVAAAKRGGWRDSSGQAGQLSATAGGAGTKPVARPSASGAGRPGRGLRSKHLAPVPAIVVDGGPDSAVFAYVDGLDGAERKVLLNHIAQAWPDVVRAGVELVAEWRAECAEHRRKNDRRREHDRRRRRRAEAGDTG